MMIKSAQKFINYNNMNIFTSLKKLSNDYIFIIFSFLIIYAYIIKTLALNGDSSSFVYIGIQLVNNTKLPYVDTFDHKGPLLYLFNSLGYLLGGKSIRGIYLLELILVLSSLISALYCLVENREKFKNYYLLLIVFVLSYVYLFDYGNLTETWSFPFQLFLYSLLFDIVNNNSERYKFSYFFLGFITSIILISICSLKISNVGGCLFATSIIFFRSNKINFIKGFILPIAVISLFCYVFLSEQLLTNFYNQYIQYNIYYSNKRPEGFLPYLKLVQQWFTIPMVPFVLCILGFFINEFIFSFKKREYKIFYKIVLWVIIIILDFILPHFSGRDPFHYQLVTLPGLFFIVNQAIHSQNNLPSKSLYQSKPIFNAAFFCSLPLITFVVFNIYRQLDYGNKLSLINDDMLYIQKTILYNKTSDEDKLLSFGPAGASRYLLGSSLSSSSKFIYFYPLIENDNFGNKNTSEFKNELIINKPYFIIEQKSQKCKDKSAVKVFPFLCEYLLNYYIEIELSRNGKLIIDPYTNAPISLYKRIY